MAQNNTAIWAIDGPVANDSKLARVSTWIATAGQTGIIGPESLQPLATLPNSHQVRIMPGVFAAAATPERMNNAYTTAPYQSYHGMIENIEYVNITATDSTGGRSDIVGIEINDPVFEGTAGDMSESDYGSHLFWKPRVIQNVAPDAHMVDGFRDQIRPFIPLARVDIPKNTSTISGDMIHDLRFMAVTRREQDTINQRPNQQYSIDPGTTQNLGILDTAVVPTWATSVLIEGEIAGARLSGTDDASGNTRVVMKRDGTNGETDPISFSENTIGDKFEMPVSGRLWIPKGRRGYRLRLWFQVEHNYGDAKINLARSNSMFRLRLTFEENPVRS